MNKKTIFKILASTSVALAMSSGHADTAGQAAQRAQQQQQQQAQMQQGPYGQGYQYGRPYAGPAPIAPGTAVVGKAYGAQPVPPQMNNVAVDPYGNPIPAGPDHPISGTCYVLPRGNVRQLSIRTGVNDSFTAQIYSSEAEYETFENHDLALLIGVGVCQL